MGTWLVEMLAFLNDNYDFNMQIFLLSRNSNNFRSRTPYLAERKDIAFIEIDIRNIMEVPEKVTFIIHAAGNPDNRAHSSDPLNVMSVITQGTDALLAASNRLPNLKKMLHISSGLVYGAQPWDLSGIPENFNGAPDCNSISAIYAESKRFSESLCSAYRSLYKIPVVIARPFAFIGPFQFLDKPWAINNFIRDCLMNGPIRIQGDGQTVRSYMYASDMAFWLLSLLVDGKVGVAYNVGSPEGVTLLELARKIAKSFLVPAQIVCGCATSSLYQSEICSGY